MFPRTAIALTIKGFPPWKEWVEGLARHCELDVAGLVDAALILHAKREGYAPR